MKTVLLTFLSMSAALVSAQEAPLPPVVDWNEASRVLIVPDDHPWVTPSEIDDLTTSPDYAETMAWLERLVEASPQLEMIAIGRSAQGRDIRMVIASDDGATDATGLARNGKPTILVHAGIHSGEIDGKDAGMMLLRDLTVTERLNLLQEVNLLFIPILNVDGHERRSRFSRINQRGPEEMGWRTNARNLNLNRDFMKLDTEGVRALIEVINEFDPKLYIDVHVTDGADYQYDITFGYNGDHAHSPAIARWLESELDPFVSSALERMGHIPGPLIFEIDPFDITAGVPDWTADPRFSHGYGDARHLPSILVENHSLDPYDQRVLGTRVFLEAVLRVVAKESESLRAAIIHDRSTRPASFPLSWAYGSEPVRTIKFLGVEMSPRLSAVSGGIWREYTGKPIEVEVPVYVKDQVADSVTAPFAWWIPSEWNEVIAILEHHGIEMEEISAPRTLELEMYRLADPELDEMPFEGHVRVTASAEREMRRATLSPGSVRVPGDQPMADLAALLLEPASPDSLFQWGFFHPILSRTEYIEDYVVEPLAKRMLEESPELREEFMRELRENEELRNSASERRRWFYERSPWYDEQYLLYPVGREIADDQPRSSNN